MPKARTAMRWPTSALPMIRSVANSPPTSACSTNFSAQANAGARRITRIVELDELNTDLDEKRTGNGCIIRYYFKKLLPYLCGAAQNTRGDFG